MIGKDWKRLGGYLKLKVPFTCIYRSNDKNMMKCFDGKNLSWHKLKNGLIDIQRNDIVKHICETLYLDAGKEYFHCFVFNYG